jgi:RimJ/RimL family protein N-acetyltransferase
VNLKGGSDEERRLHEVTPAPSSLATARLVLRRPTLEDAPSIFAFASAPEVTRYVTWPTHAAIENTARVLDLATREWNESGVGVYFITLEVPSSVRPACIASPFTGLRPATCSVVTPGETATRRRLVARWCS